MKKKLTICKKCYAFYYDRLGFVNLPGYIQQESEESHGAVCPTCLQIEVALNEETYEQHVELLTSGIFS